MKHRATISEDIIQLATQLFFLDDKANTFLCCQLMNPLVGISHLIVVFPYVQSI